MKKLLFLYPIEEFIKKEHIDSALEKFNDTIANRYRNKGYEINFLMFPDKKVYGVEIRKKDKIIQTDKSYSEIMNSEYKEIYPSNDKILKELEPIGELVVTGFHSFDCVKKVAKYFDDSKIDTLVDLDLTEKFIQNSNRRGFNQEKYNLEDMIQYIIALNILIGYPNLDCYETKNLYRDSFYKRAQFRPTISYYDALEELEKRKRLKR